MVIYDVVDDHATKHPVIRRYVEKDQKKDGQVRLVMERDGTVQNVIYSNRSNPKEFKFSCKSFRKAENKAFQWEKTIRISHKSIMSVIRIKEDEYFINLLGENLRVQQVLIYPKK